LSDLTLSELQSACGLPSQTPLLSEDVFTLLQVQGSVEARAHLGGTAPKQVLAAIKQARSDLNNS
jgi:argininosuccinate lyase